MNKTKQKKIKINPSKITPNKIKSLARSGRYYDTEKNNNKDLDIFRNNTSESTIKNVSLPTKLDNDEEDFSKYFLVEESLDSINNHKEALTKYSTALESLDLINTKLKEGCDWFGNLERNKEDANFVKNTNYYLETCEASIELAKRLLEYKTGELSETICKSEEPEKTMYTDTYKKICSKVKNYEKYLELIQSDIFPELEKYYDFERNLNSLKNKINDNINYLSKFSRDLNTLNNSTTKSIKKTEEKYTIDRKRIEQNIEGLKRKGTKTLTKSNGSIKVPVVEISLDVLKEKETKTLTKSNGSIKVPVVKISLDVLKEKETKTLTKSHGSIKKNITKRKKFSNPTQYEYKTGNIQDLRKTGDVGF